MELYKTDYMPYTNIFHELNIDYCLLLNFYNFLIVAAVV